MTNRNSSFRRHLARGGACLLLGIVPGAAALGDAANADTAWQQHVTSFLSAHFQANPVAAAYAGRHEFDGRLPDLSAAGIARNVG